MYIQGQRWFSETEPELGLGVITTIESKRVTIHYPLTDESRIYSSQSSPLKRFVLDIEDTLITIENHKIVIQDKLENEGLIIYRSGDNIIPETLIHPKIELNGPQDRVMMNNFDSNDYFDLRYQGYLQRRSYQSFEYKGFLGPNIRLIPHQIYVTQEVLKQNSPKVMLCDEVGLGKTIEAGLIVHSLIQKELISKILIIVPESLVFQWFVELYKKFNLTFATVNSENRNDYIEDNNDFLIVSAQIIREDDSFREIILSKSWDALVVDESHQINYEIKESPLANLIKDINHKTYTTLFLSATPEVMGEKNLFNQLQVLDKEKYQNFNDFTELKETSHKLGKLAQEIVGASGDKSKLGKYFSAEELSHFKSDFEIVQALIDRYGTGRSYFRNSRANLEKHAKLFTKRIPQPHPLVTDGKASDKTVYQAKLMALFDVIQVNPEKKIFVICHAKSIVMKLYHDLQELANLKLGYFHSGQSLLERDRQAAFFANPDGAQILLSTEIGSEGRNFEFSNQLFLFDLPKLPDQLEQRIGRLDRIGQKNDVNIHIPYIKNSFEEVLFSWYHEVLEAFNSSPKGGGVFYQENKELIVGMLEKQYDQEALDKNLKSLRAKYTAYQKKLEEGRDLLVEMNSYNDQIAKAVIDTVVAEEKKNSPEKFLDKVFDRIGIDFQELDDKSFYIKPTDNMLIPSFAGLTTDGLSVTFDRDYVIARNDLSLMSKEHPIYKTALDIVSTGTLGNSTLVNQESLPRDIYFEFIITLQCTDEAKHLSSRFLPFTPIRILLNSSQEDITKKIPKKMLDEKIIGNPSHESQAIFRKIPKDLVKEMFKVSLKAAGPRAKKYIQKASEEAKSFYEKEFDRARVLKSDDLASLEKKLQAINDSISQAKITIDAVRIILPQG